MNRNEVIAALREHETELKAIGVLSLSLFGSVARDDVRLDSDIDIAVRLADNFSGGGLDYFYQLEQLQQRLSRLLGRPVDIVTEPVRKQRIQSEIDKDRTIAF